jgi:hypothetical protein
MSIGKQKCCECNKNVSVLDIITCKCRCGNIYCKNHRIDHKCSFDYKELYKETHKLIKIDDNKLDKI